MKSIKVYVVMTVFMLVLSPAAFADLITTVAGGGINPPAVGYNATEIDFYEIYAAKADQQGNLYIANYPSTNNPGLFVTKVGPWGKVEQLYGDPGIAIVWIDDLCIDRAGNIFIPAFSENLIYKITPKGAISAYAGNGTWGYSGDGGPATSAQIETPESITVDANGDIYFVNNDLYRLIIRKVERSSGLISTLFDGSSYGMGNGDSLYADSFGNVYFTSYATNHRKLYQVNNKGILKTIADVGANIIGISGDEYGNLYFTHRAFGGDVVKKVDIDGNVTTIATITEGRITRISCDRDGMVYFAMPDSDNKVKKITFAPQIKAITPEDGAIGDKVTIAGRYFTSKGIGGSVSFGGVPAEGMTWNTDNITCIIPPNVGKFVDVVVTSPEGQVSNNFSYKTH